MNHRIVSTAVLLLIGLFASASVLFALAAAALTPSEVGTAPVPRNPHAGLERTEPCLECHAVALGTIPVTHRNYAVPTCGSCHRQAPRVLVPHSVAMGDERCLHCHGDPGRDLGMPAGHLAFETYECLLCHPVDPRSASREPAPAGLTRAYAGPVPHPLDGYFRECLFCHQSGERNSLPDNHRRFEEDGCTECHEPTVPLQ
ncbi:MAG: hypothetical protein KGZ40_08660 [Clostridiales bacterium]|nr:hypothetical protein [Clostridiales bacterium]